MPTDFKTPLSVYFVWHPGNASTVQPLVDYCSAMLQRNTSMPFSRSMNLPVFIRTTSGKSIPSPIKLLSKKTIIFCFVGTEVCADEKWVEYLKSQPSDAIVIPISLDNNAFKLNDCFKGKNFIRLQDFDKIYLKEHCFIAIANEIYRFGLNSSFNNDSLGKNTAIKQFLSHAKGDPWAVDLAKTIKHFIDNSSMRNFFDVTDIAPAYYFDKEIIGHLKESTVIAIHSDTYSSRYWCQKEILFAKQEKRPILAVDCLSETEDRSFPFSANIPSVHLHAEETKEVRHVYRILCLALLETLRFNYHQELLSQYQKSGWIESDALLLSRPPEAANISDVLQVTDDKIDLRIKKIYYPEPPVYPEEVEFFTRLGIETATPLTANSVNLQGRKIGISISDPTDAELLEIGQTSTHLLQLSQDIARHLLSRNATLLYGGDLRPGGFTEFIFNEAAALQNRLQSSDIFVHNYFAWPLYTNQDGVFKSWKAKYCNVAKMIEIQPPAEILPLIPNTNEFLAPSNFQNQYIWSRSLSNMRLQMIQECSARICAGGKHSRYKGKMPGVLEEINIALQLHKPLYLLGGFGGVTESVCHLLLGEGIATQLTETWQITNNTDYKELIDYFQTKEPTQTPDYQALCTKLQKTGIKGISTLNGLSEYENKKLFSTPFFVEAIFLILKGLNTIFLSQNKNAKNT